MKRNYSSKSIVRQGLKYLCRALEAEYSRRKIREDLRGLVNSYSGLNRNERYSLYIEMDKLHRAAKNYFDGDWHKKIGQCKSYDAMMRVARRVERQKKFRDKQKDIRRMLDDHNQIFFLCTVHDHPAPDHAEWQGKVYVDRFWRTKVSGEQYYAVLSYIRNRKVRTVQWVMGEPVWMTTRPNCKHSFIPLTVEEVLSSSPRVIAERHRYKMASRDDYYEYRAKVYSELDLISPCKEFKKIKNRG